MAKCAPDTHTHIYTQPGVSNNHNGGSVLAWHVENCKIALKKERKAAWQLGKQLTIHKRVTHSAVQMRTGKAAAAAMRRKPTRHCRRWRMSAVKCLVEEALRRNTKHCCNSGSGSALSFVARQTIEWWALGNNNNQKWTRKRHNNNNYKKTRQKMTTEKQQQQVSAKLSKAGMHTGSLARCDNICRQPPGQCEST